MIRVRNLHKSYTMGANRLHVLKGIDLDIGGGELVSIMGASGSGKSTLMNILGLLDQYDEGSYRLDGEEMDGLTERRAALLRSRSIGFVFQSFHLIPFKTAAENVALPLFYQGVPRRKRNRIAAEYLAKVGLSDRAEHLPRELSGGQQQRVAIARALITQPKVLLADEPTGALDSQTSYEILKVLQQVQAEGVTVIIITHERDIAGMTDRIIHLIDGKIDWDKKIQRHDPEAEIGATELDEVAGVSAETLPGSPAPASGPEAGASS
ncbi:MAG: ABC transporter ATP-binding protein [Thermoanaerobaculia bacterium]|nr:ABC transporter ATP-binding protein [Thermoanaerobaculia bacterium]